MKAVNLFVALVLLMGFIDLAGHFLFAFKILGAELDVIIAFAFTYCIKEDEKCDK